MTRRSLIFILLLSLVTLNGCIRGPLVWQRMSINHPITQNDVAFIANGLTTLAEVVGQLGSPDELLAVPRGAVANYHFSDGRYFRVDYGWGLRFVIPFYSPEVVQAGGGVGIDMFQITFDEKWVVQHHAFAFHPNSSKLRFWPFGD